MDSDSDSQSPIQQSKKLKWTAGEDCLLREAVEQNGTKSWNVISSCVPGRTGKQCRERWLGQLSPNVSKNHWSLSEDMQLINCQKFHGNKWSTISKFLPGRSPISVKNRWSWLVRHGIPQRIQGSQFTNDESLREEKKYFSPIEIPDSPLFGQGFHNFLQMLNIQ